MIRSAIASGIRKAARRSSLIVLLYFVGLALAALLSVPVFRAVDLLFGESGFSPELARRFDVVLWADMIEKGGSALAAAFRQLMWAIPLFVIWKTASHIGLMHALHGDGQWSFWEGVGRFTLRGLPLAMIYLFVGSVAIVVLWIAVAAVADGLSEPGRFWTYIVIGPVLTVLVAATLDLMHDYARIQLVLRGAGVWESLIAGSIWPAKRLSALFLYDAWFAAGAALWLVPFWLDASFAKVTIAGMLGAFLLQQVAIIARQAVTVGWIGAEVSFFEALAEPASEPASYEKDRNDETNGNDENEGVTGAPISGTSPNASP